MRSVSLVASFLGLVAASPNYKAEFETFLRKYRSGRKYGSVAEHLKRFEHFVQNMKEAENTNIANRVLGLDQATYGMTKFSDWSKQEWMEYNALRVHREELDAHKKRSQEQGHWEKKTVNSLTLPTSFDWREKGAVTPVKDQGACGSCWAFGTVASIEGNNFVKTGSLLSLSEQELVSCDKQHGDMGCNGGLPSNAYSWMMDSGNGLESEADYSYASGGGFAPACSLEKSKERVFLQNYHALSQDEDQMAQDLMTYGPLAVAINANPLMSYTGGIVRGNCFGRIDHAVTVVGFGEENGVKFWTVKNSWNTSWGEDGYFRMERGVGQCLINSLATAADVSENSAVFV